MFFRLEYIGYDVEHLFRLGGCRPALLFHFPQAVLALAQGCERVGAVLFARLFKRVGARFLHTAFNHAVMTAAVQVVDKRRVVDPGACGHP